MSTISKLETRHCESAAPVSSFYIRQEEVVDSDVEIKVDHLFDMGSEDDPDMIWLSLKGTEVCLFDFLRPINNLSVKQGRVFLC